MKHKRKRTIYYCEKGFYVIVFATLFFLRYRIVCAVVGHINRVLIPFVIYEMMKK